MSEEQKTKRPPPLQLKRSPGTVKPRKMPTVNKHSKKSDGFAIGVTASHYWIITAIADGKNSNRMAVLEEVINHYVQTKLSRAA